MNFLSQVKGFTPVIDILTQELGLITACVYGVVWRYCQMEDKVCKASLETIANHLNVDKSTALRHIKILCENGYLHDLTPDYRNKPHIYADTGRAKITGLLSATVAENNATVAENNATVAENQLKKVSKKVIEDTGRNSKNDYLPYLVNYQEEEENISEPSDFDKHFGGYRDEILDTYHREFEVSLNQSKKAELIELGLSEQFDYERFVKYAREYNLNGGHPYNIKQFTDGYWRYVQGSPIKEAMYPDSGKRTGDGPNIQSRDGKNTLVIG